MDCPLIPHALRKNTASPTQIMMIKLTLLTNEICRIKSAVMRAETIPSTKLRGLKPSIRLPCRTFSGIIRPLIPSNNRMFSTSFL